MMLDVTSCYRALTTHDARFDGRFFVGVSSTRIYCRPVCTVRTPRRENCRFFPSAAAAEVHGYRPCLRCRPELAPGHASVDATARLGQAAVDLIENGALDEGGLEGLASRLGVTSRHLRRVFAEQFGVAPIDYAQTQRLLLAKHLLTDTSLPVTEIALASGFQSLRRFNALFKSRYRMAPSRLRKDAAPQALPDTLKFELAFRPPYAFDALLEFLRARAIDGVETVTAHGYRRSLAIATRGVTHVGTLDVRRSPRKNAVSVGISASFARVVPQLLSRVKHAFDLGCDPSQVAACLGPLAETHPGLRVPGAFDGFELAVRAVIGQQITVRAARTLLGRFVASLGTPLDEPFDGVSMLFPTAERVAACAVNDIAGLGMPSSRARTLLAVASSVAHGDLDLAPGGDVESTIAKLQTIPGIGSWTAHYIAMRALRWPDAFLANDRIVLKAMNEREPARARFRSEAWRPWRAYAVMHLWKGAS